MKRYGLILLLLASGAGCAVPSGAQKPAARAEEAPHHAPTADTLLVIYLQRLGAAGDAGR